MNPDSCSRISGAQRRLVGLLIASIFINYIDRANLSVAAPVLAQELSLSPVQIGSLLAAFFWSYSLFQLFGISGWLADRFPATLVLAGGFLLWTVATLATAFVSGLSMLFLMRLLLGAGESIAYPCYSRILASDVPQHHRGKANALIDAGSKLGPAAGTLIGGIVLAHFGWRVLFFVLGAGGLLWLPAWLTGHSKSDHAYDRPMCENIPSLGQVLRSRSAWGAFCGHFCGNYFWYFLLTWLPSYLVSERSLSLQSMTQISSLAFLLIATATVSAGWVSDRWIAAGHSTTLVRKGVVVSGLLFSTIILPVVFLDNIRTSIVLLLLSCFSFGTYTSNHWAITQTLAGPLAAGRWTGIQNGFGNLSGIIASWLTGYLVQRTGSFHSAFVIASLVAVTGALMWGVVVKSVKEVDWV